MTSHENRGKLAHYFISEDLACHSQMSLCTSFFGQFFLTATLDTIGLYAVSFVSLHKGCDVD